ncbi:polysaccharide deacetylase family protein [Riemerella columbina]|uniref:polysaccharide deacetylase family protein n=1 Tax=Riemerella columbina TaxID=103810 RepID=UPI002670806B|nr:polysaccharide deacetylase family protein [Riemerella columbina]WKS94324.1 polysaccharide deacetylase family protein [Riemerella columbina]
MFKNREGNYPFQYFIPVYHSVSDEPLPHLKHIIRYKNIKAFEQDLEQMLKRFNFVDWDFFVQNYQRSPQGRPLALMTFDDGLVEFKEVVAPILERKGIYAVNFVNPQFIVEKEMMFRYKVSLIVEHIISQPQDFERYRVECSSILNLRMTSLKQLIKILLSLKYQQKNEISVIAERLGLDLKSYMKRQPIYMDLEDLKNLSQRGFGVAAHSWSHPLYRDLSLEEQLETTQRSLDFIREHQFLDAAFAFPFSDDGVSLDFFNQIFDANPRLKLTFGISGLKLDDYPKNLHRIPIELGYSAQQELNFESHYYRLKSYFSKNQLKR